VNRHLAIVPAFNESTTIRGVIADLRANAPEFDVVVVDDGSSDNTSVLAHDAGAHVLTLPFNLGIGGAMQTGFRFAASRGYDLAVQVDGDGQHDADEIRKLKRTLEEHPDLDMVVGSRFLEEDAAAFRSSAPRRAGIRLFAGLLSLVVRQRVTDPTSGFRVVGPRGIQLFADDYPHDYPEVEAILMVHAHRLRTQEVPVLMRERQGGVSSITSLGSIYYMVKVTLAVVVGLVRARPVPRLGEHAVLKAPRRS
jgi:glycosyltransferase involved in cell wall biosynthesis